MKPVHVLGIGCVASTGPSWSDAKAALRAGRQPTASQMSFAGREHTVLRAPLPEPPPGIAARVRRSSPISLFACAAADEAWAAAGAPDPASTALVLAASDGAVVYTRRFYDDIVKARPASPLLFPETVYNAPASHIAAALGLDGEVLTCVGDSSAAATALELAAEILHSGGAATCLVVAAEEIDPVTCEAYRLWRLAGPGAAILSEGAVALVLGTSGGTARIEDVASSSARPPAAALADCIARIGEGCRTVVRSRSGSPADRDEVEALAAQGFAGLEACDPKLVTGEAFAASGLLQIAVAADFCAGPSLVTLAGWNGQSAAVRVSRS